MKTKPSFCSLRKKLERKGTELKLSQKNKNKRKNISNNKKSSNFIIIYHRLLGFQ